MLRCPKCSAAQESPLGCSRCGALSDPPEETSPFDLLGLPQEFEIDRPGLQKRLLGLQRLVHPDFFAQAEPAQRALAERNAARLNRAHEILADDFERANWLVLAQGGPGESSGRSLPSAFLAEVLEWNELLERAREPRAAPGVLDELEGLAARLRGERQRGLQTVARLLRPQPGSSAQRLVEARAQLHGLRYLDRTLAEIETLRLARASLR